MNGSFVGSQLVRFAPMFQPPPTAREFWIGLSFTTVGNTPIPLGNQLAPSKFAGWYTSESETAVIDQVTVGADAMSASAPLYRFIRWPNFNPLASPINVFGITGTEFLSLPSLPIGDEGGVINSPSFGSPAAYPTAIAPIIVTVSFVTRIRIDSNTLVQLWGRPNSAAQVLLFGFFHGWTWNKSDEDNA